MIEFRKYYHVHCCETVIRHEWKHWPYVYPERVQTHDSYSGNFLTKEEAEKHLQVIIDHFKPRYSHKEDEITVEKDNDNKCITIKLYTALKRNYIWEINNTQLKRKTKPFFTIIRYYSICDTTFGYNDSEKWKEEDPYCDRNFEEPHCI